MFFVFIFAIELVFLFFLSRALTRSLSRFLSIQALSFLFLPGIIIHELSHLLTAAIMLVPVGEIEFMPKPIEGGVKLGSVAIGKSDPIRRSIIGFAPVFAGLMLIFGIIYFLSSNILFFQGKSFYIIAIVILAIIYILFAVSNTMFSSSRDMEGTLEILITLLIIGAAAYFLGFRPSLSFIPSSVVSQFVEVVQKSSLFLLAPIFIDLIILGTIKLFKKS